MNLIQNFHELKAYPAFFWPKASGDMPFDVRYNDRGYQRGDIIIYREWDPDTHVYTGKVIVREVTYVMTYGLSPNYVGLGLRKATFDALQKAEWLNKFGVADGEVIG